MSPITENEFWVSQLQSDDNEVFKAIYRKYNQAVYANISRLVSHSSAAEDLLQEVFIALWEGRHKLTAQHDIAGWLFTTSFYKSSAWLRKCLKESLSPLHESLHETPCEEGDSEIDYAEKLTALHTAIELLPPRKKMAFRLCRLEGKSYEEAAQELGLSIESVKDYVKTASRFVRDHVLDQYPAVMGLVVLVTFW